MNKRILELWEQSADKFPHGIKTNPERFAELIIKEHYKEYKTYVVWYSCWDDSEFHGVFSSEDIAEKYIEISIKHIFKVDTTHKLYSKYRSRYTIKEKQIDEGLII